MKRTAVIILMLGSFLLGGAVPALAIPTLQLDILGGGFNTTTADSVNFTNSFTLRALLFPEGDVNADSSKIATLADTFYISAALVPGNLGKNEPADINVGSFTYGGTAVAVSSGMAYGVPPIEQNLAFQSGDLSKHGIFPTWYIEFPSFQFS